MRQKTAKNQWNCIVLISIKLRPHYFSINSKVSFPQRARKCLLHSTTNHFFSFHLCPIGNTLTLFSPVLSSGNNSSQSLTGLYNLKVSNISKMIYFTINSQNRQNKLCKCQIW